MKQQSEMKLATKPDADIEEQRAADEDKFITVYSW